MYWRDMNSASGASSPTPDTAGRRHVLVVDDDVDVAESYRDWLQSQDYVVTVVNNGAEALRFILKTEVDAILCDLMMPHMSGDMFYLAVMRSKPHLCKRFIFVTGQEGNPEVQAFLSKINSLVLYKPISLMRLMGTLEVLFRRLAESREDSPR